MFARMRALREFVKKRAGEIYERLNLLMERRKAFQSYTSYDYLPVTCIPVIASFDSDGRIAPLYVRIDGVSYKIDSYWIRNSSHRNIIEYNCKIIVEDYVRPLLLSFHVAECVWTMPK